jgi:hypothetical protein
MPRGTLPENALARKSRGALAAVRCPPRWASLGGHPAGRHVSGSVTAGRRCPAGVV